MSAETTPTVPQPRVSRTVSIRTVVGVAAVAVAVGALGILGAAEMMGGQSNASWPAKVTASPAPKSDSLPFVVGGESASKVIVDALHITTRSGETVATFKVTNVTDSSLTFTGGVAVTSITSDDDFRAMFLASGVTVAAGSTVTVIATIPGGGSYFLRGDDKYSVGIG